MKTKEEILESKFKERGIQKGWLNESKQAVLDAMDEYADARLRLFLFGRTRCSTNEAQSQVASQRLVQTKNRKKT